MMATLASSSLRIGPTLGSSVEHLAERGVDGGADVLNGYTVGLVEG